MLDRPISERHTELLSHNSWRGALGAVTALGEIFDLYLYYKPSKITEEEIFRWLKAGRIDTSFRKIILIDENIKSSLLKHTIHVTITSDYDLANNIKDITKVYFLKKKQEENIQDGINFMNHWRDIVKDITIYSF